jgi:hypothetical protein
VDRKVHAFDIARYFRFVPTVSNGLQANSARFDFARTNALAFSQLANPERVTRGIEAFNDSDPAVVGMSAV